MHREVASQQRSVDGVVRAIEVKLGCFWLQVAGFAVDKAWMTT